MREKYEFGRRVNLLFGVLCLTVVFLLLIPYVQRGLDALGISVSPYVRDFGVPQVVYPLLNLLLAVVVVRVLPKTSPSVFSIAPLKKDFWLWSGLFLGGAALGNMLTDLFLEWLQALGYAKTPVFSQFDPETPLQAVLFFVAVVVLPAICEEALLRGMVAGGLRAFHPGAAVLLSSLAFSLIHINIQQAPFAFLLGLILGLAYVKTGNLLCSVLLHFMNNAWACAVSFCGIFASPAFASSLRLGTSLLFLVWGTVSLLLLLRKNAFSLKACPASLSGKEAFGGVIASVGFWGFCGLFGLLTVLSLFSET